MKNLELAIAKLAAKLSTPDLIGWCYVLLAIFAEVFHQAGSVNFPIT